MLPSSKCEKMSPEEQKAYMAKEKERNQQTVKLESNAHKRDVARSKDDGAHGIF